MTTKTRSHALHRLTDSDLQLADPRADIRGRQVFERQGSVMDGDDHDHGRVE